MYINFEFYKPMFNMLRNICLKSLNYLKEINATIYIRITHCKDMQHHTAYREWTDKENRQSNISKIVRRSTPEYYKVINHLLQIFTLLVIGTTLYSMLTSYYYYYYLNL